MKIKKKDSEIKEQIRALEDYLSFGVDDRWQYELALLYEKAGEKEKCSELCNQMFVWFGDSEYVRKALEIKQKNEPLTPFQEQIFQKKVRFRKPLARNPLD
jgi:hypothetical protein